VKRVTDVAFAVADAGTRVEIESSTALSFNTIYLSAGSRRILLDFPKVRWSIRGLTSESGSGAGDGLVAGYRFAHNTAESSRLILDLAAPARISRSESSKNGSRYKLVLDLKAVKDSEFQKIADADLSKRRPDTTPRSPKPLIVIDPGHGGKDPGSISPNSGAREKDFTLKASLALRDALLATGRYDVRMTRSTDEFIELEDRVTRARNWGADLFLAIHADSGSNASVRGASVYTLSQEGEKRIEGAKKANDWVLPIETDASRPREVNAVLADLVQRETKNQSARFAQVLMPHLKDAGWPALENAHRRRGFYVLLNPDVPAILLEMGFITNAEDEAMMASDRKRDQLCRGITAAVDEFFASRNGLYARR
jgi:N-acetylmuramoyl-L-alanine amidase